MNIVLKRTNYNDKSVKHGNSSVSLHALYVFCVLIVLRVSLHGVTEREKRMFSAVEVINKYEYVYLHLNSRLNSGVQNYVS